MSRKNNFNLLRIFAALLVAVTHSYAITGHSFLDPLYVLTDAHFYSSTIGLYIFFFTSGYLVTRSAADSATPLIYSQKRILRIYPALICVVFISVFIAGPLLTTLSLKDYLNDTKTYQYLWTATGLKIRFNLPGVFENNKFFMSGFNGSLWSIKLELEMYGLLLIFLVLNIFKNKKILIVFLCSAIILLLLFDVKNQYSFVIPDHKSSLLACAFLFGGIVQTKLFSNKILLMLLLLSTAFITLKIIGLITVDLMIDEVIFFSLITYFIAFSKWFTIILKTDISYGIYIYTFPVQQLFFQLAGFSESVFSNLLLSLCSSAALAFLSWMLVEKPALLYKNHLKKSGTV